MSIGRQRLQARIGNRPADGEVVHALHGLVFDAEQVMHAVIKVTADSGAAHFRRFNVRVSSSYVA